MHPARIAFRLARRCVPTAELARVNRFTGTWLAATTLFLDVALLQAQCAAWSAARPTPPRRRSILPGPAPMLKGKSARGAVCRGVPSRWPGGLRGPFWAGQLRYLGWVGMCAQLIRWLNLELNLTFGQ